jgi:hypothetical protein
LFYYTLEYIGNKNSEPTIFFTESETSSNSLFNYLKSLNKINFVVLCFGGVNSAPPILPLKWGWCTKNRYILIDYDGNEKAYNERVNKLGHFDATDIKLALPKGEDINSLWMKDEMGQYDSLFNKII